MVGFWGKNDCFSAYFPKNDDESEHDEKELEIGDQGINEGHSFLEDVRSQATWNEVEKETQKEKSVSHHQQRPFHSQSYPNVIPSLT